MEKMKSSLVNMIVVLVGVAAVTGSVLAWVNNMTEKPIADKAQQTLAEGIRSVMGATDIKVDEPDSVKMDIQGNLPHSLSTTYMQLMALIWEELLKVPQWVLVVT